MARTASKKHLRESLVLDCVDEVWCGFVAFSCIFNTHMYDEIAVVCIMRDAKDIPHEE